MKFLVLLFFICLTNSVKAQSPWFFGSNEAVNLTNGIRYQNGVKNITGTLDPTVTAVNAPAGSLYESTSGVLYVKQDAGSSTNWFPLASVNDLPTINGETGPAFTFATGTSGTDFAVSAALNTITFNLPTSSATNTGKLSSSDWTTFNSKAGRVAGSFSQYVYVNYLSGSNVVCPASPCGDGSLDRPYQTINFAMSTITDATQNKPYVVGLLGSRQVETSDILVKPYTSIVGMGQRASYVRAPGFNIKPDPSHSSGSSWVLLKNFYLGGGTGINWDLQAIGGSNCVLVIENMTIGGNFTYKGRNAGGGDYLEAYVGIVFGTITMDSVFAQWQTWENVSAMNFTNTQAVSGLASTLNNMVLDSNLSATDHSLNLANVAYNTTTTITTTGTLTLESFRGLPPKSRRTISGGTTINYRDDATMIPYAPTTPGDWGVVPTDVSGALDYLAANIAGGSIASINAMTGPAITIATGTTGTDFNISNAANTVSLNLPTASATNTGKLSSADWLTFNNKVSSSSGSSVDNHIATWDSTTGKVIQDNSTATLSDAGALSGLTLLDVDNLEFDGNSITTTNANGDLSINPNGTGLVNILKNVRNQGYQRFDLANDITTGSNATLATPAKKVIRLTGALTSVDMIPAGTEGQEVVYSNVTGSTITFNNEAGATVANRILTGINANLSVPDTASIELVYDVVSSRWRVKGISSQTVDLATGVTGVLPLANGGTNKNMTAVNGGIVWTDADSMEVISAGTSGQVLQSNGAAAPSWVTIASPPTITSNTANFTAACNSINLTTNAINVQLPSPVSGCQIVVKKRDSSTVTILRAASEQIEGVAASWSMEDTKESNTFISDGTNWFII